MTRSQLFIFAALAGHAVGQFPPRPEGVTYLQSKFHENVTLSFKEVSKIVLPVDGIHSINTRDPQPGLCETTPGVKSYAGYVHLPASFVDDVSDVKTQEYPINT